MTEKMKLTSLDVTKQRREEIKSLFPSVFTETENEKGEMVESVDFEKLKAELGEFSDVFESRRERYGTDWPGKKECMRTIQQPSVGTLVADKSRSKDFDASTNVFIQGDNLETLKLLQKSYFGQVELVYIDPPYNTGKEFIYPDNYTESLQTYLEYAGLTDSEGRRFSANTSTEGRFHTKWLQMMYPRLYLARNVLSETGSVWISIDDNELPNLRAICNEIFGEENFVATFIWQKRTTRENRKVFSFNHDYIVCYARDKERFQASRNLLPLGDEVLNRYSNPDNDPRGKWQSVSMNAQAGPGRRKEQFYSVTTPGGRVVDPPAGRCWTVVKERMDELIADNRIWFGESGNNVPREKVFLSEARDGLTPHTLWTADEVGTTDSAKKALIKLFDGDEVYDTPKPVELLQRIIQIATDPSQHHIVMDFFAGSGTTPHAVLEQNEADNGNRRFVAVQLPEPTPEDTGARKAGFDDLAEVCIERLRRASSLIDSRRNGALELDDSPHQNTGFRVFALRPSHFLAWRGDLATRDEGELVRQLELHIEHVSDDASPEDILYELLLKAGYKPTDNVEVVTLAGAPVFSVEDGCLLICLESEVTRELIDLPVKDAPQTSSLFFAAANTAICGTSLFSVRFA